MQYFARVLDGVVVEVIPVPDGLVIGQDIYTPEMAATLVPATADTTERMTWDGHEFGPVPAPPPPTKAALKAYAADKRWRVETGGITVAGATIATDRDSQSMITGAFAYSQAHPDQPISYKANSGWVTLDAATLAAIASAVGAHVQASFAIEATVVAAIDAGTITTFAAIDAASWPSAG